jgi:hypothetical protein
MEHPLMAPGLRGARCLADKKWRLAVDFMQKNKQIEQSSVGLT